MKNPYDKNSSIIGSDVCKKGTIAITSTSTGTYDASYASSKKKKKYSKQITSSWSSNYTKTNNTNISNDLDGFIETIKNIIQDYDIVVCMTNKDSQKITKPIIDYLNEK